MQRPIARVENLVSERWTVLILWEIFLGSARFDDIQVQTGATPQMLAARLKKLEKAGLVQRRRYNMRPLRHEYVLTEMGTGLLSCRHGATRTGRAMVQTAQYGARCPLCPSTVWTRPRPRIDVSDLRNRIETVRAGGDVCTGLCAGA